MKWSVVTRGKDHSYAVIDVFDSKKKAEEKAQEIGQCFLVEGTQMRNEPIGQVEEHTRIAWSKWIP